MTAGDLGIKDFPHDMLMKHVRRRRLRDESVCAKGGMSDGLCPKHHYEPFEKCHACQARTPLLMAISPTHGKFYKPREGWGYARVMVDGHPEEKTFCPKHVSAARRAEEELDEEELDEEELDEDESDTDEADEETIMPHGDDPGESHAEE
jgi:hypothetical protein